MGSRVHHWLAPKEVHCLTAKGVYDGAIRSKTALVRMTAAPRSSAARETPTSPSELGDAQHRADCLTVERAAGDVNVLVLLKVVEKVATTRYRAKNQRKTEVLPESGPQLFS
jgi:hypothetical protein